MKRGQDELPNAQDLVLIVEDETPIAEALTEIVSEAGYRVLVASNGRAGLDLARAERPALVITDLMMPYLDGAGLVEALRADASEDGTTRIPIVVMTAAGRAFADRIPYDALLPKPFDLLEVERLLGRFLHASQAPQHAARDETE
jgi:CheY-like chemotaxis protein